MDRVVLLWNDNRVHSNDLPLLDDKMPALQTQMVLACNSKGPQAQYRDWLYESLPSMQLSGRGGERR
jgi:hypothetical protein